MPECEAHRRNKQALYEISLAWGNGNIDLGKLQHILKGDTYDEHSGDEHSPPREDAGPPRNMERWAGRDYFLVR